GGHPAGPCCLCCDRCLQSCRAGTASPKDLTCLLWAFAMLDHAPLGLLGLLASAWAPGPDGDLHSFSITELTSTAWALAVMKQLGGGAPPQPQQPQRPQHTPQPPAQPHEHDWQQHLKTEAQQQQQQQQQDPEPLQRQQLRQEGQPEELEAALQEGHTQLHGLEAVGPLPPGPGARVWAALCSRAAQVSSAGDVPLTQVWQCALSLWLDHGLDTQSDRTFGRPASERTAAAIAAACQHLGTLDAAAEDEVQQMLTEAAGAYRRGSAALKVASSAGAHSGYQRQVANTFMRLGLMHMIEDCSSGYAVDIGLPQLRVAVEVDGPSHFCLTHTPRNAASRLTLTGPTAMKRRHLQKLGWATVSIRWKEWDLLTSPAAQEQLVQRRLRAALEG
ncbi:RAP domain-containing protein, partial [Haematococcus lacustris]